MATWTLRLSRPTTMPGLAELEDRAGCVGLARRLIIDEPSWPIGSRQGFGMSGDSPTSPLLGSGCSKIERAPR